MDTIFRPPAFDQGAALLEPPAAQTPAGLVPLLGESEPMEQIRRTLAQVADTDLTVLLQGESGTGKEVVARLLCALSSRAAAAFVKINCAAIPHELLESELFGYEAGAFTGATRSRSGKFELAGGGTIFLDEISEMPLTLQAKLLHVLQDGEFSRLGGRHNLSVDVRVIAATNVNLAAAVVRNQFRRDLFYRLNVITIQLPPLRQRRDDIPLLVDYFVRKYADYYRRPVIDFPRSLLGPMTEYPWPGNIRELENMVKRFLVLRDEGAILAELMLSSPAPGESAEPIDTADDHDDAVLQFPHKGRPSLLAIGRDAACKAEREAMLQVLAETRWNRRLAAKRLNISYKGFQNKLKVLLPKA